MCLMGKSISKEETGYVRDNQLFSSEKLNTDQWVKTAKDAGSTFAILTVTHETGFELMKSEVNPYCLKAIKWRDAKGDVVRNFVISFLKYDIKAYDLKQKNIRSFPKQ